MKYKLIVDLWNEQADEYNQWDSLGEDKKIDFTIARVRKFRFEYATMTGFTLEEIQKMVETIYGSCVWERIERKIGRNYVSCSPNSTGEVHIFDK